MIKLNFWSKFLLLYKIHFYKKIYKKGYNVYMRTKTPSLFISITYCGELLRFGGVCLSAPLS